jgi:hypothetical protein
MILQGSPILDQPHKRALLIAVAGRTVLVFMEAIVSKRDTYKYHFKRGPKIVHSGITNDLERREQEHQRKWPRGHIKQVGRKTTEDAARKWEEGQKKA